MFDRIPFDPQAMGGRGAHSRDADWCDFRVTGSFSRSTCRLPPPDTLGYRRTGRIINDVFKSAFNGAIRRSLVERDRPM